MVNYPTDISGWRDWTRKWWRAVAEVPRDQNPVLDEDGNRVHEFQTTLPRRWNCISVWQ